MADLECWTAMPANAPLVSPASSGIIIVLLNTTSPSVKYAGMSSSTKGSRKFSMLVRSVNRRIPTLLTSSLVSIPQIIL
ncbi:hypothetical protein ACFLSQ_11585, partial [Bacteroidota bacterium]